MRSVITGKAPISITTVAAILSLSLVVNLPGLAVTPMLETIKQVFPGTTQLEVQLLTMLPNVLIIPFVLLSGKFSETPRKMQVVMLGLVIFTASAIAYFFAKSMAALIVISCVLGAGAGILVPFSTGLIADTFSGTYKMKEMGVQSGVANLTLVAATFIVGWLQHGNWHLPFAVYLVAIIPLILSPFLRRIPKQEEAVPESRADTSLESDPGVKFGKNGFSMKRTVGLFALYTAITFLGIVISYYTPFLAQKHGWSESLTGTVTSIYFLFIFLPGFFLSPIVRVFRQWTGIASAIMICGGLALFALVPAEWTICVGAALVGLGYGILQPIIYDKATRIVDRPAKATLALAIILSANYIAIVIAPFIIDGIRSFFGNFDKGGFAFLLNFVLSAVFLIVVLLKRNSFSLAIPESYYNSQLPTHNSQLPT